jgi:hypothetical protein
MVRGKQTTPEEAEAELRAAGYEPEEPYPGKVMTRWKVRCAECKYPYSVKLNNVRSTKQQRCTHKRLTPERAVEQLRESGYEPLEAYPGEVLLDWSVRCIECKEPRTRSMVKLRKTRCRCLERKRRAEHAEVELRAAGYEPLVDYPGNGRDPWRSRCVACGQERKPNMETIRAGVLCKHETPEQRRSLRASDVREPLDESR